MQTTNRPNQEPITAMIGNLTMINKNSRTRIVATLVTSSSSKEILRKMIDEGVDVFRLNFSHTSKQDYLKSINLIKEINTETNFQTGIMADLYAVASSRSNQYA